jgi:hypothetical protein
MIRLANLDRLHIRIRVRFLTHLEERSTTSFILHPSRLVMDHSSTQFLTLIARPRCFLSSNFYSSPVIVAATSYSNPKCPENLAMIHDRRSLPKRVVYSTVISNLKYGFALITRYGAGNTPTYSPPKSDQGATAD